MNTIPVFYCPQMIAPSGSFSPSAEKPALVVASFQRLGLPLELCEPVPVTQAQLSLAHDPVFVREILARTRDNGFGNRSARVADSLPYTSGSMLSAARHVSTHGGVAVAPCSGFHHAGYAQASGFCTFNGLMVTASVLRSEGIERVGILDCDHHYGDGTDDIISRLDASEWVHHVTVGERWFEPKHVADFFARLPKILDGFVGCDVVLYQAGADPHVHDPLGGWMTSADLRERDATVFEGLYARGIPVAWNLAGGYQTDSRGGIAPVLAIHDQTLRECARVYLAPQHAR